MREGIRRFCTWSGFIDMDFPSAIRKVHGHQCTNGSCTDNGDATSLVSFAHVDLDCCLVCVGEMLKNGGKGNC